jgi:hypothetical protein
LVKPGDVLDDSELGSNLGLIAPIGRRDAPSPRVDFLVNFVDATNEDFLERLRTFEGPKNYADVGSGFDLAVPDLRSQSSDLRVVAAAAH